MIIYDGVFRGVSDTKYSGIKGSFAECVGVDGHNTPGVLQVRQGLAKDSGTTVTEFCKVALSLSTGFQVWFSADSGKIWARNSSGTWALVYTTSAGAGEHKCLGASEFNGYVYWATSARLHRIAIASATATASDWTGGVALNWATFSKANTSFKPMAVQNNTLFVGDGNLIASVTSAGTFADGSSGQDYTLDIKTPYIIKCLSKFDTHLVIGTYIADTVNEGLIIRWDTQSDSWSTDDEIPTNGVNAFMRDDNYLYAQCGQFGQWYYYDGSQLIPFFRIPGTWTPTSYGSVNPNAVGMHLGVPVFGLSNGSGNPANQGLWSFGSYSKDYDKVLDLSYPVSAGLTGVEIGAVLVEGANMYCSWKLTASGPVYTYGVDKLNWSAKYTSAYIVTMVQHFGSERGFLKSINKIFANYSSLPASTGLTFQYKLAHNDSWSDTITAITDTNLLQIRSEMDLGSTVNLQLKISFTVSSNNSPVIESIGVDE